jgi:small-conductance mechanosensitive channel
MHPDLDPAAPDPMALRRRVLLAALITLVSFFVLGYLVTALNAAPWLLLPALLLVLVLVVRPLMAPVLAANRLRRRLAYRAFLDSREDERG